MSEDPRSTVLLDALPEGERATLSLVIIGEGPVLTYPLPEVGAVRIGRAPQSDLCLADSSVSRHHAVIHVEPRLAVEDLGSGNGTFVNGRPVPPGEPAPLEPRDLVELGDTLLLVQSTRASARRWRLYTHDSFEARLEDACAAGARARPFTVLRVRVQGEATPGAVEHALTRDLGPQDLLAAFAPGEFEVLCVGPDRAEALAASMQAGLPTARVRVGVARFPRDGKSPDALLEHASRALLGRATDPGDGPVVEDEAMRNLYRLAERVAKGRISVLLLGETGVGKEVFAEAIHRASPRRERPYVKLNCAAISEALLESELFGHERGAFTGAEQAKPGLLEVAAGGTVFLDEVAEMSLATQAKLLRAIEQRQVLRVGGLEPRTIDARFVSATNRDPQEEIRAGRLRQDLFYRLEGVTLQIPPLRERPQEILPLARAFARRVADELELPGVPSLSPRAAELLMAYHWPGNIRELRNVIERALLLTPHDRIDPEHLPLDKLMAAWRAAPAPAAHVDPESAALEQALKDQERRRIEAALEAEAGNQTRAAERLGISRRTLSKKLDEFALPRPRKGHGRDD